jgi:hypothetical protein
MSEHPPRRDSDDELERERRESTDLGYRDTEEERAYEDGSGSPPSPDDQHGRGDAADN